MKRPSAHGGLEGVNYVLDFHSLKRALQSFNITNIREVIRQPFSIRLYELHILEHVQLI